MFSIFSVRLFQWNSRAFCSILVAAICHLHHHHHLLPALFFYISFNMRCKDIGFQSMTLTFISDARVCQTPWGLPTLYLRVVCRVHNTSCQYRGHYCIQIHIFFKRKFNFHLLFYVYGTNTFGNTMPLWVGHQAIQCTCMQKPKHKFPIVFRLTFRIMNVKAIKPTTPNDNGIVAKIW